MAQRYIIMKIYEITTKRSMIQKKELDGTNDNYVDKSWRASWDDLNSHIIYIYI